MISNVTLTLDNLKHLEQFQELLPQVREYICQYLPRDWADLTGVCNRIVDQPLGPLSILPLASCAAVNGDPTQAIPVAAAWEAMNLAMRIWDDLQDQDHLDGLWAAVGIPRASNFGAGVYVLSNHLLAQAPWSGEKYRQINQLFIEAAFSTAAGQDRDLCCHVKTLTDYWQTIQGKSASGFAMVCAAGACCSTNEQNLIYACRTYGYHLGLALQILNDLQGLWFPSGLSDLQVGKLTLPVLYGLNQDHPHRGELQALVDEDALSTQANRVQEILDNINTRDFMIWAALEERKLALNALKTCPNQAGVTTLTAYITTLFADIETILSRL